MEWISSCMCKQINSSMVHISDLLLTVESQTAEYEQKVHKMEVGLRCLSGFLPPKRGTQSISFIQQNPDSVSWLGLFFLAPSPESIHGVKQMSSFIACGWDIISHSRIDSAL